MPGQDDIVIIEHSKQSYMNQITCGQRKENVKNKKKV